MDRWIGSGMEQSCKIREKADYWDHSIIWNAVIGNSGNVIYIDAKDEIVVAIASSFKPAVYDRITFIQHNILPYIDAS